MDDVTFYWWQSFFILLFGFPTAFIAGTWIVAKCIWMPFTNKCIEQIKKLPPLPYEYKYPFIHDAIIQDNSGTILEHTMVLEHTPQGWVLLRYNEDQRAFDYWCDADVQYRYLETVARKYVQSFRCEHLYIHRYEELNKINSGLMRMTKGEKIAFMTLLINESKKFEKRRNSLFEHFIIRSLLIL